MLNRLESSIEGACRRRAEAVGFRLVKFTRDVGDPDRILMATRSRVVLIEFKRPRRRLEPIQAHRAEQWRAMGFRVERVDSVAQFDSLVLELLAGF